ncbi:hypothetical protein J6590_060600 [Homalodisca vitripennis]|nr:hypothetical protein J6590_060600 [Homalodisca vitripennis]
MSTCDKCSKPVLRAEKQKIQCKPCKGYFHWNCVNLKPRLHQMLSANVGQLLLAALLSTNAGSKCWQQMLANSETDQHVLTTFLRFGAFSCILHSEMSTLEQLAAVAAACVIIGKKKRPKRYWVRPSLRARSVYSGSDLLSDLNQDDINPLSRELRCDGSVKNFLRMTRKRL